jgi:hypothetical protein
MPRSRRGSLVWPRDVTGRLPVGRPDRQTSAAHPHLELSLGCHLAGVYGLAAQGAPFAEEEADAEERAQRSGYLKMIVARQ